MEEHPDGAAAGHGEHLAYFLVRIEENAGENQVRPSGMIERLGSGHKQSFSGADELIRLLTKTPGHPQDAGDDSKRQ